MKEKDLQADAPATARLFLAVPLPDDVRTALSDWRGDRPDVRWTRPDTYHLTLRFLGDRTPEEATAVAAACRSLTWQPFSLCIQGVGGFPDRHRPRVLWAGVAGDLDALHRLQADVEWAVQATGMEPEPRPYQPHVTLGRARKRSGVAVDDWMAAHATSVSRPFVADRFHLYESRRDGGVHHVMRETFTAG